MKEIVYSSLDHPTDDESYDRASTKDGTISKGTVYRNLNLLSELGEIRKLQMPLGPDHSDFNISNHYHFICRNCFKVVDADIPYKEEQNNADASHPGYETEWNRIILVGLCPECKKILEEN